MEKNKIFQKVKSLYKRFEEIINYLIIGAMTTGVSLATKYLLLFTVFDAKDSLQLQLSIIISWIAAVLFAYVTNRIFVFKSKNTNIINEIFLFFSARVVTLVMESVILWFFITLLKMNSDMHVIIWTIVSQIFILIGNYILSKFFVFNKENKVKKLNSEKIFNILIFIMLTCICYFFPYTHDDWAWGSQIGIDRLNSLFHNYNGRWCGNLFVLLLTRSRILRTFIVSITLYLIVKFIQKNVSCKNNLSKYILILLMLIMPVNIIAQSIAWTAGFANYVVPILVVLMFIYLNRGIFLNEEIRISNKLIIPLLIAGFCCSLFVEHITIYNVLLSISVLIYCLYKNKKINWANFAYMIGSIAGAILMFSNGAYHQIIASEDTYRTIETSNIFIRIIKTYFGSFYNLFCFNNIGLNFFISGICLSLIYKYFRKNPVEINKKIKDILSFCALIFAIFISYSLFINIAGNSNLSTNNLYNKCFEGILVAFYYISILVSVFICVENKNRKYRVIFEIISSVIISAPLLVVTPIGPRCFFPTYVMMVLFAIDIFDYAFENCKSSDFIGLFKCSIISIMLFFFIIYGQVYLIDCERINYLNKHNNDTEIILPKLPYENYMQLPNPINEEFNRRFKLFYKINENASLTFIKYNKWKKGL